MTDQKHKEGVYIDGSKDTYVGLHIQRLAEQHGWVPQEGKITNTKDAHFLDAVMEAEDWLNDYVVVEGCFWGYNEYGDFGLWRMLTDDELHEETEDDR